MYGERGLFRPMRLLVDANVHHGVGSVFVERNHIVDFVNESFLPGTPDHEIETVARADGWIIVSHDETFLKRIQQPRFNYDDLAASGFGRIMLCTRESLQVSRISETLGLIELLHAEAIRSSRRFLLTIGPNWIRFDDRPANKTPRSISRRG